MRSFGMPLLVEYRWLRGLRTDSASFSTAIVGDGMSGVPNGRSLPPRPPRRNSIFNASICANAYGGSALMRRNSITDKVSHADRRDGDVFSPPITACER